MTISLTTDESIKTTYFREVESNINTKINSKQFFAAVFNYCKSNDTPEIIAQNIYGELDNIPEICIDPVGTRDKINFALRPHGIQEITELEIWRYNLKNEPIDMLISIKANNYWFNFLKTDVFDEEIILDIYNYCT